MHSCLPVFQIEDVLVQQDFASMVKQFSEDIKFADISTTNLSSGAFEQNDVVPAAVIVSTVKKFLGSLTVESFLFAVVTDSNSAKAKAVYKLTNWVGTAGYGDYNIVNLSQPNNPSDSFDMEDKNFVVFAENRKVFSATSDITTLLYKEGEEVTRPRPNRLCCPLN